MKNHLTYKKLILLFAAVIIPVFLFSLLLFWKSNNAIQSHIFSSIQEKTNLTAQTLDSTMGQIYTTALAVAEQSNLKRLTNSQYSMTTYETAKSILQLREQQISIMKANQYIDNFAIYYQERGQAYNSHGASYIEFTPEEYRLLAESFKSTNALFHDNENTSIIVLPGYESNYLIRVTLSHQAIESLLKNALVEYQYDYLLEPLDRSWQLTNLSADQMTQLPSDDFPAKVTMNGTGYYHFFAPISYGNMQLHFFLSEKQIFKDLRVIQYWTFFFSLSVLMICILFLWGSYTIIQKPIQTLINSFQDINNQNYNVQIPGYKNSDFSYLYEEFNHMAKHLKTLIEKDYQQQLLLNKAELKQLQAQINPHFLYNSLFLLRNMIYDCQYDEAQKMADTLGQYFQYITRNSRDYMSLDREYHHALLYCEIQKLRFEGRIHVETDSLPAEYNDILVPKLIIQPLLENAFNYGLHEKVNDGLLKVSVSVQESDLIISVEDNGETLSDQRLEELKNSLLTQDNKNMLFETTGILNIRRRLNIYFNSSDCLKVSRSFLGGLCVQLIIPIPETI